MKLTTRHPDLGTLLPLYLAPDDGNPPAGGASPEDRLAVLESANARQSVELAQARKESAELKAECSALKSAVEVARTAEAKRRAVEVESYITGLKHRAAPNAIAEPDLAKVRALFDRGDDENARFVGDLLLKGAAPAGASELVGLGPRVNGNAEAAQRGAAELLAGIPVKAPRERRVR